jgi:micrococcal nuclease
LELDQETGDGYGRLLAYVYVRGSQMINEQMVLNGLAYFYPHRPNNRYDDLLLKTQRKAMLATRGIWRHWKQDDRKVIGNRRSRRFHASTCPDADKIKARNRIRFDTPWQAFWEGYAPARKCIKKPTSN